MTAKILRQDINRGLARGAIFLLFFVVAIFIVYTFVFSSQYSYSSPKTSIEAYVTEDGTLDVFETRTFSFDDDFSAIWWDFSETKWPNGSSGIEFIDAAFIDAETGEHIALKSAPFMSSWRYSGGNFDAHPTYSIDSLKDTIYIFEGEDSFSFNERSQTFRIHYSISNFAQIHKDIGYMYWQFVGSLWSVPSYDVDVTVHLPNVKDENITPGKDVYAFAYGPQSGSYEVHDDGTIEAHIPFIPAETFAEIKALFPADWIPEAYRSQDALSKEEILKAEQQRFDAEKRNHRIWKSVFYGSAVAVLLLALLGFRKYGKEYTAQFQDDYWREAPRSNLHPAAVGRIWRFGKESVHDFSATLVHLSSIGLIKLDQGASGGFIIAIQDGWENRLHKYWNRDEDTSQDGEAGANVYRGDNEKNFDIDFQAIVMLQKMAQDGRTLSLSDLKKGGMMQPSELIESLEKWQGAVTSSLLATGDSEYAGSLLNGIYTFVSFALLAAGTVLAYFATSYYPLVVCGIVGMFIAVISAYMPRRTQEANEVYAKSVALRRWLVDFTTLEEKLPTDVLVWGKYLVYATLFGVSDKVIKGMQIKVPEVLSDSEFIGTTGTWFTSPSHGYFVSDSSKSPFNIVDGAFSGAIHNAHSAIAESSSSVGGSFGRSGGFSSGGGGGFGGGGGGAR